MSRITIQGGNRFHAQYRPSRTDPRIRIQPMDSKPVRFANRHGPLIGALIAMAGAVVFCGGML